LYGNEKARWLGSSPAGSPLGVWAGLALIGLVAAASLMLRLGAADLGIALDDRRAVCRSLRVGLGVGLLCSLLPIAVAVFHLMPADRPERNVPWEVLLQRVALNLPFDTVLPEELAFRGLVLAWLMHAFRIDPRGRWKPPSRDRPPARSPLASVIRVMVARAADWLRDPAARAVILAAVPFALWHLRIAQSEMVEFRLWEFGLKLGGYFLGGILFGYLRVWTGHLAGSLAAHWVFIAAGMLSARASTDIG
jgi:membrane protease YdiL (CAAX protease family)